MEQIIIELLPIFIVIALIITNGKLIKDRNKYTEVDEVHVKSKEIISSKYCEPVFITKDELEFSGHKYKTEDINEEASYQILYNPKNKREWYLYGYDINKAIIVTIILVVFIIIMGITGRFSKMSKNISNIINEEMVNYGVDE